jgi:hypothetical protein
MAQEAHGLAHAASQSPHSGHQDGMSLGTSLGPALTDACCGRLSHIEWFRSTWQHGGAATGFALWRGDDGRPTEVLVKLPVGPVEHRWTIALSEGPDGAAATPRILASGTTIGGYDLAWLVMERLDGHTLTHGWCKESLEDLLRAAARMQACAAARAPVSRPPSPPDWERAIAHAREIAKKSALPEAQHWNEAVKRVQKVLPRLAAKWSARPIDSWCHGDLHPGNAMRRRVPGGERPPCILIDLALVHPGNWVEDAVYLERQFWGRPDQLFGVHPVSVIARCRRELGLPTDGDYGALANLRRVLMAACAPVNLAQEGHPRYLHAALETLERLLPQVVH